MKLMRILSLVVVGCLCAGPSNAESQSERDSRRASYIAGFSCWFSFSGGQQARIVYEEGGGGEIHSAGGGRPMSWWVREDQFCRQFAGNSPKCIDLPKRDIGEEERKFGEMLRKGCLF